MLSRTFGGLALAIFATAAGCGGGSSDTAATGTTTGGGGATTSTSSASGGAGGSGGAPAPSDIGDVCKSDSACGPAEACIPPDQGFPDGYCTAACDTQSPCPDGSKCLSQAHYCFLSCASDADCRPGYQCMPGIDVCLPPMGGDNLPPGTNNGAACDLPIVQPPGEGKLFGPDQKVSSGFAAAEVELAADPVHDRVVVAWIEIGGAADSTIGVAISDDGGATFVPQPALPHAGDLVDTNNAQSDPVVAVDPDGSFHVAWVGFDRSGGNPNPTNMAVYVATAKPGGGFDQLTRVTPPGEWDSGSSLDKPWIAASPVDGSLWVTWSRFTPQNTIDLRLARSTDAGATWSAPLTFSETAKRPSFQRNLAQITVGADAKAHAAWIELSPNGDQYGSTANVVYTQRFNADGTLDGANLPVTGGADSPSFEDPSVTVADGNVYVGFTSGDASGAWDLRVAASLDGGSTWQPSIKATDDATCATHFHHQLLADPKGGVHLVYYDNRYLVGNVFHQSSPGATAGAPLAFGAASFVNSASFPFTTRRDTEGWLGDYLGFWIAGSTMYAAWSDPRNQGTSQIYFAKGALP